MGQSPPQSVYWRGSEALVDIGRCAECAGELQQGDGFSVLSRSVEGRICGRCRRKLLIRFAAALAVLGLGVALSPVLVNMPAGLFFAFGAGLILVAGVVLWQARGSARIGGDVNARFYVAIFGPWLAAYYVANLACGEWNPLLVGCNDTCRGLMWGSLGSMAALAAAYIMGYRQVAWLMLGVTVLQNYPHCQCENGFYIPALRVQPFCLIVPTLVGLINLWMLRMGRYKPLGFALVLSLLAGAFAVAITHRLGIPIVWRG